MSEKEIGKHTPIKVAELIFGVGFISFLSQIAFPYWTRSKLREMANGHCEVCGANSGTPLENHHRLQESFAKTALVPSLAYQSPPNGECLCSDCHDLEDQDSSIRPMFFYDRLMQLMKRMGYSSMYLQMLLNRESVADIVPENIEIASAWTDIKK